MGRPKEHGADTREQLLRAAGRLLATEGADALSVRRVSGEVGVSSRAVYSLFGSMDGLLTELFRRGAETLVKRHEQVPRCGDAAAEILPLASAYRRAALEAPDFYRLVFERAVPSFHAGDHDTAYVFRGLQRVQDAVERALAQRRLGDRDPVRVTRSLWVCVHGLASLELRGMLGPPADADAAWHDTITALVAGLLPGPPVAGRPRRKASPRRDSGNTGKDAVRLS